jgi:hypothetical protein
MEPVTPLRRVESDTSEPRAVGPLHPAWTEFIRYCRQMRHGEIHQLKIQDGLPMIAETVRQKVKFTK